MKTTAATEGFQLLTISETAEILHIAPQTLRNWIAQRRFPHFRIGRANMVSRNQLIQWIESQEVKTWP